LQKIKIACDLLSKPRNKSILAVFILEAFVFAIFKKIQFSTAPSWNDKSYIKRFFQKQLLKSLDDKKIIATMLSH
jgi:hypothetical protein